jgi:shikimate kinase
MKTNVALIGFMGVGKTAVGEVLAKKLNRKFVELDLLIEQKAGKSIPEIFQQDGEVAFRELEIEATKEIAREKNLVIACGGGVVLNKINIDRLREESRIVCLTASPRVILERISGGGGERPLLKGDNPSSTIQGLLRFRKPFYQTATDIKIDTSKLDVDSVAEQIISRLKEDESFNF